MENLLAELSKPFHPSEVSFKPGAVKGDRALALAYADLRVYMSRLDEVCGTDWSIEYKPWGDDRIIACLTINGTTRSSTGEMAAQDEKNEMGGTVAEAQSFKRACVMFGLGRYLYNLPTGWGEFDPAGKRFTDQAKAKLTGILTQHYRKATEGDTSSQAVEGTQNPATAQKQASGQNSARAHESPPHSRLWGQGQAVFGTDWDMARGWLLSKWTALVTPDNTRYSASELNDDEKDTLADYLKDNASKLQKIWPTQKAIIIQRAADEKSVA